MQTTNSAPSNAKAALASRARKRHPRTIAQDRALITAAIELIQTKLDLLPQHMRIEIIAEITRRLTARLTTEALKIKELQTTEH